MGKDPRWMVVRSASFAPHWAAPEAFGPMSKTEAERMVASRWGGHMLTLTDFVRQYPQV